MLVDDEGLPLRQRPQGQDRLIACPRRETAQLSNWSVRPTGLAPPALRYRAIASFGLLICREATPRLTTHTNRDFYIHNEDRFWDAGEAGTARFRVLAP